MSAYRLAVLLSGGSAGLGLLRELIVFRRLGLGADNDQLQVALSITYTIALLGEPLRMASLNLLSRGLSAGGRALLGALIVAAMVLTTSAYVAGALPLPTTWVLAAAVAGALNLLVAWTIPPRLRDGPFLAVHALTVLPNVVIVAGLLWPAATDEVFAGRVVLLFLMAPLAQLLGFGVLGRRAAPRQDAACGAGDLWSAVGWHGVAAAGTMGTQFVIRAALTAVPGTLSAFTLMLRITETVRAVFVDSWAASRVQRWAREGAAATVAATSRLVSWPTGLAVMAAGLMVALWWPGPDGTLLAPAAMVVLVGLYPVTAFRVSWQARNAAGWPGPVVRRIAAWEIVVVGASVVAVTLSLQPTALLPWLAYVVRPAIGTRIVAAAAAEVG